MKCPNGHGIMPLTTVQKNITFRDTEISVTAKVHVCPECKLEAGTVEQTAHVQQVIADAYRKKVGLLTGRDIRDLRKKAHITQEELAERTRTGIASIKRWEGSQIQTKSMDQVLRKALADSKPGNNLTGNRDFSIPRVKLVMISFESCLGFKLLKDEDKMLFSTKYVWYADMIAYRDLGKSMTGSSYAALPYGPQLNNYRDLLELIKKSDAKKAEPLTEDEQGLILNICKAFPTERKVYNASHKEVVWKNTPTGTMIPYSAAADLMGI